MTATDATTKPDLNRLTAVRRLNGTRNPYIVVTLDGVELGRAGGARAARAEAALVTCWPARVPRLAGLRKDLHAAQVEADRMESRTSMTTRGRYGRPGSTIPLNRPDWAVAVPVVDEAPAR